MPSRFARLGLTLAVALAATVGCSTIAGAPGGAPTVSPSAVYAAPMESWNFGEASYPYPALTGDQLLLWPPGTTTGGVSVGPKYWVWPYTFWLGPPPYVPRVTTW